MKALVFVLPISHLWPKYPGGHKHSNILLELSLLHTVGFSLTGLLHGFELHGSSVRQYIFNYTNTFSATHPYNEL